MPPDWTLEKFFTCPDKGRLAGGILTTYGIDIDVIRSVLWPALYGPLAAGQIAQRSKQSPVTLVMDRHQMLADRKPRNVGGWPILAPQKGRQHSKVWVLWFNSSKTANSMLVRLGVGSHNLTWSSFINQIELSFKKDFKVPDENEADPDLVRVLHDATEFLGAVLAQCESKKPLRSVECSRKELKAFKMNWLKKIGTVAKLKRRATFFVAGWPQRKGQPASSLWGQIEAHVPARMSKVKKEKPEVARLVTPFFDRTTGSLKAVLDVFTRGAKTVEMIGPQGNWEMGETTRDWLKQETSSGRVLLKKAQGPKSSELELMPTRALHAKLIAWKYGKTRGVVYLGSGNLTNSGMLIPPPKGNYEAGLLVAQSWKKIQGWLNKELQPEGCKFPDIGIKLVGLEPEENALCPILEVVYMQDGGLEITWDDEDDVPLKWSLEADSGVLLTSADDTGPRTVKEHPGPSALFFDQVVERKWIVPVVDHEGYPALRIIPPSWEDAMASYRRGLQHAQHSDEDDDNDPGIKKKKCRKDKGHKKDLTYELRQSAEDLHTILDHIRNIDGASMDSWFREDLLFLIKDRLKLELHGPILANELWEVASIESKPFDDDVAKNWKKAIKAVKPTVTKLLEPAEQPYGSV